MPKTGGNSRPVGRPGGFLLSVSDQYFKRAWANTFAFLIRPRKNRQRATNRRVSRHNFSRTSHF